MYQSHYEFLVKVLGKDGANALRKAQSRSSYLGAALLPRAIFSWIANTVSGQYEGEIPGISNTYLVLSKSEMGYSGKIKVDDFVWNFNNSSIFQVAAGVALALDVDPPELQIKDVDLTKLGKSVDLLVKHHSISLEIEKLEKKVLDPDDIGVSKIEKPMKGKPGLPMTEGIEPQITPSKGTGQSGGVKKPKLLKIAKKDVKNKTCLNCGATLYEQDGKFKQIRPCLCARDLMKNIKISSTSDFFEFDVRGLDSEEISTLLDIFGIR